MIYPSSDGSLQKYLEEVLAEEKKEGSVKEICEKVFKWQPPIPVIYEFFTLNGEKISSSRGNVITLSDWLQICEPEDGSSA